MDQPCLAVGTRIHSDKTLADMGLIDDADAAPFVPVPWFWSDQYDRKIQLAGRVRPDDDIHLATGTLEERRFAALYGRAGKLVGVLGFNRPRHVMQYKTLIEQGASFDEAIAADL